MKNSRVLLNVLFVMLICFTLFNCDLKENIVELETTQETAQANSADLEVDSGKALTLLPSYYYLDFVDAYLVYVTSSNSMQIATEQNVLSYGGDWQKKKIYPYLYHIKHNSWSGYYWKVNTSRKEVYLVIGPNFGRIGDPTSRTLTNITVDNVGSDSSPIRFFLRFNNSYLRYNTAAKDLRIYGEGFLMSDGSGWEKCHIYSYLYHIKLSTWQGFYWKINTSRKEAYRVTNAPGLCQLGGTYTKMNMGVRVY